VTPRSESPSRSAQSPDESRVRELEALFTANLALIARVVRHIAARRFLERQEMEDFEAEVHLKLIQDHYAVLGRFEGRSSLSTYLVAVIQHAFLDYQVKRWGKWRPSAPARRHGPLAIELERLLHRDGLSFEAACAKLSRSQGGPIDRERLAKLLEGLPYRPTKREVGTQALVDVPSPYGQPSSAIQARELQEAARSAETLLGQALERLSPGDRLLLKLAYVDGLSVARIASTLGLNQRRLYRSLERCLGSMRTYLESRGLERERVAEILGAPEVLLNVESLGSGPSHSVGRDAGGKGPTGGVS
jgi:RNA polymerase sigma factor (sigma-70 family)